MPTTDPREQRILVLAPTGRDAALITAALTRHGLNSMICPDVACVCREMAAGAGMVLIAEEGLLPAELPCLVETLRRQPHWSDLPLAHLDRERRAQPGERPALSGPGACCEHHAAGTARAQPHAGQCCAGRAAGPPAPVRSAGLPRGAGKPARRAPETAQHNWPKPTSGRTSSWLRWPTNSGTLWHRCATLYISCASRGTIRSRRSRPGR